jgi:ferredoxin
MAMADEVYLKLAKFLDRLPGGYPETPDGLEIDILKYCFTPDEAEMAMRLRLFPEPPAVIARRSAKPEAEVSEMLAEMAQKGLIIGLGVGDQCFYMANQFVVGIHEFHVDSIDREYFELVEPYMDYFKDSMTPVKQFRVVPVNSAIDTTGTIASYDQVRSLVKGQSKAAVADCICKKGAALKGEACGKPVETCLVFDYGADLYIRYGKGREITIEQALDIIEQAEREGLVLMPTNSKEIMNICCCCSCCCGVLKLLRMTDRPADHIHSDFSARVDPDSCTLCETCLDRCQIEAIVERDGSMYVDPARCIGCGLCVSTCEQNAMSLVARPSPGTIPENQFHMLTEIARERGVGFGALSPMMKRAKFDKMIKRLPLLYRSGIGRPMANFMAKRGWI